MIYILRAERKIIAGIDEMKEYIRLRVWSGTEHHKKGMNGDKIDVIDKVQQKKNLEVTILV